MSSSTNSVKPIEESSAQLMGSRYHATSFLGYRNRNFNIAVQLGNWADQDGTGICFDSSTGFTAQRSYAIAGCVLDQMECWNALRNKSVICTHLSRLRD